MEIKTKIPVTIFKESNDLRKREKITPKETETEIKIFFKKVFKVKLIAKNNGTKKFVS